MILLLDLFLAATLLSIGFVGGCFWSTNFLRERMASETARERLTGTAEVHTLRSKEPTMAYGAVERSSAR